MKKLFLSIMMLGASIGLSGAQQFEPFLKTFVVNIEGKYMPEISSSEAVMMGVSVDSYNAFVKYVETLNQEKVSSLTAPENLFLNAFMGVEDGIVVLNITREKALRAGASIQGYNAVMDYVKTLNTSMGPQAVAQLKEHLDKGRVDLIKYATENPDKSAVQKVYTPPTDK